MKPITDYILEEKLKYELPEDFEERTAGILNELTSSLPGIPNVDHVMRNNYPDGEFWFNKWDLLRNRKMESTEFIGYPESINLYVDTEKEKDFNVNATKDAFKNIFGATIKESVFDDNITKELPEYSWVFGVYDALSKFFKTKSFNKINWNIRDYNLPSSNASLFRELKNKPTVEKNGLIISLYAIDLSNFKTDDRYSNIGITVIVYEKKDLEKVATIKNYNNNLKPLDVVGRELMPGDTVAYADIGGYGKFDGMKVDTITAVSKEQVTMGTKRKGADQCCLISRKDGKRIE